MRLCERHADIAGYAGSGGSQGGVQELPGGLRGYAETRGDIGAGMADTDGQGAIGVAVCDKPLAFDLDYEVNEAGSDLVGYGYLSME